MAIMVIYRSDQVSAADYAPYEQELAALPLPPGGLYHFVGHDGRELTIVDIWESREALEAELPKIQQRVGKFRLPEAVPQIFEVAHTLSAASGGERRPQPA